MPALRDDPFRFCADLFVTILFALGLMAKPMLVTLPFVLLLLDYWPLGRFRAGPVRGLLLEKAPWLAMSVVSCLLTRWADEAYKSVLAQTSCPLPWRLANALVSYATYVVPFFYPAGLAALLSQPR